MVKDFLPIVQHMHLKDYVGGQKYLGYSPLGQGKVDIPAMRGDDSRQSDAHQVGVFGNSSFGS